MRHGASGAVPRGRRAGCQGPSASRPTSRLRSIVGRRQARELTYEPDTGRYEATIDIDRVADVLGGHVVSNAFGRALVIDRRYESDRYHGTRRIGECELQGEDGSAAARSEPGHAGAHRQ